MEKDFCLRRRGPFYKPFEPWALLERRLNVIGHEPSPPGRWGPLPRKVSSVKNFKEFVSLQTRRRLDPLTQKKINLLERYEAEGDGRLKMRASEGPEVTEAGRAVGVTA